MPSYLDVPAAGSTSSSALSNTSSFTLVNSASVDNDPESSFNQELEELESRLVKQTRIMEGAEKMLTMDSLNEFGRHQLESELASALSEIKAIQDKKNDIHSSLTRTKKIQEREKRKATSMPDEERDDFRTALQNAQSLITALSSITRPTVQDPSAPTSSSGISVLPESAEIDAKLVDVLSKLVVAMQRNLRVRYELKIPDLIKTVIPALADKRSKHCRASAYRLIRHALVDAASVQQLEQSLDWYIVRSLTRDSKFAVEKEQVIKLIRTIVEVGAIRADPGSGEVSGSVPLSETVMRAFIAVAEHTEDPFRPICIQTLAEILLIDIDLVSRTGGVRFLLQALGDGPVELTPILASTFLHLVDSPRTRPYFNLGTDLELALSPVTDAYGKGTDHIERMKNCAKVIQLILRNWSGLMYFCMDNMRAIRSIIDTLRIPSLDTRDIILDMFFDLLNIKTPTWYQPFIDGRRLTVYQKSNGSAGLEPDDPYDHPSHSLKLTDQYIGLLILVFAHAGLLDALSAMLEEIALGSNLSRKATLLMAEILQMANRVLPMSVAARIQALPRIFKLAAAYDEPENRITGTTAMSAIDSLNRNRTKLEPLPEVKSSRLRANSVEDAIRRGQRQVEQVKLKMSMQMDDRTFRAMLLDSQVMITKEHSRWQFDILQELVEGPLLNPKRMEEAIKGTAFIRRLMSFYHPFSHRFSDTPKIKGNIKWVKLGCSLLSTLMSSADGVRYLSTEDPLLSQVVKSFAQLDPFNGTPEQDPIFSKKKISNTLTYGYLEMLGTLSKYKEGIELMEKFKIFTAFYHLSELKSREDLIKAIIQNLDYTIDGHQRIVLSKTLTSSYKHIRGFATDHLGKLIRQSTAANAWTLRLLITQLYDPAHEVCEMAIRFLEEACESKDVLQLVVELRPSLDHLGDSGNALLLKFISTPTGFRYLFDAGFIVREMELWFTERNLHYVVQVEVFLAKVFSSFNVTDDDDDSSAFEGTVPPHFYGEMSKTEYGCQILEDKGHFTEFAQFIRQHADENEDPELIMKLKSILWAVGNVGATEGGLPFLEEEEIIPLILRIAEESPIPSVRGTCFFVLGLISSTSQGAELLDDYRWEATLSPLGLPTGLCIPRDFEQFIYIPPWEHRPAEKEAAQLVAPTLEAEIELVTSVQSLANTVIANAASRSLAKLKSKPEYRSLFTSPTVLYRVLHIISTQRYRLPVRRYIMEMFNVDLNEATVAALEQVAIALKPTPTYEPPKTDISRRVSVFRSGRSRQNSESDEEVEVEIINPKEQPPLPVIAKPAISLRPVSKIIGFAV